MSTTTDPTNKQNKKKAHASQIKTSHPLIRRTYNVSPTLLFFWSAPLSARNPQLLSSHTFTSSHQYSPPHDPLLPSQASRAIVVLDSRKMKLGPVILVIDDIGRDLLSVFDVHGADGGDRFLVPLGDKVC